MRPVAYPSRRGEDAAPQDEGTPRTCMFCCTRAAAITSSPQPATDQQAIGAQCNSGAYSGSFCKPPATAAIRAKVASASAENTRPVTLPSAPVWPIASAADTALISMQPQAAPATNCATISVLRLPAPHATCNRPGPARPRG